MSRTAAARKPVPVGTKGNDAAHSASPLEWTCAAVGLFLFLAAIGYLVYIGIAAPSGPPVITFDEGPVTRSGDGYVVDVVVGNQGATTAAEVEIEGTLRRDGDVVETSGAVIDYLPRSSQRDIGLFFSNDPRQGRLDLRAKGYVEP